MEATLNSLVSLANRSKANESNSSQTSRVIQSLYDVLYDLSYLQCYDSRDRLFVLLHTSPDVDLTVDTELAPNYTVCESEILHRLAIWTAVRKRHTSYLSFAVRDRHQSEESTHRAEPPRYIQTNSRLIVSLYPRATYEVCGKSIDGFADAHQKQPFPQVHYDSNLH